MLCIFFTWLDDQICKRIESFLTLLRQGCLAPAGALGTALRLTSDISIPLIGSLLETVCYRLLDCNHGFMR